MTAPEAQTHATADTGGGVRRLVLLRHAKAEPGGNGPDHHRALALAGRQQATRVGEALTAGGLVPDLVLCSSALRTRQTWELVASRLDGSPRVEVSDDLYECTLRGLLGIVTALGDDAHQVLVVGHEPTVSTTATFLAGPESDDAAIAQARVGMPTSAYAVLDGPGAWSAWDRSTATLTYLGRPATG
ncbi:SixA phosphatase family protein [Luteimicrobium subarcticum]|uniref:Phosphohistidine phosphatase n=1 Tax=Luteimicrobium subarcticum TaxID=620910 RepID=A0A2M8WWF4_9MICO|nr:histidine phosphatase family protein [Luteimicrobium subarcticum]PJI95253.1 phosphohistidine phosphatase [Luteimicrobium subarcticum]